MLCHLPWRTAIVILHAARAAGGDPSSHSPLGLSPLRFLEHIHPIAFHLAASVLELMCMSLLVVPEVCLGLARRAARLQ